MTLDKLIEYIKDNLLGEVIENANMTQHCYIKTGGEVRGVFFPKDINSLVEILKIVQKENIKYKILGRGSNIILPNKDLNMLFIKISNTFDFLEIQNNTLSVGSGYSLQRLAKSLSKRGLSGFEFAGGIPGTVGGAVFMNAGAHTREIKDVIEEVSYLDENLNVKVMKKSECKFGYRDSIFQHKNYIILGAKFNLKEEDKAQVFKRMLGNLEYRKEMQPLDKPTFGSVFKNPPNDHAGKIIEELGLKGKRIGGAQVSEKHANFIENIGDAKAEDIKNLIEYIQKEVKDKRNIQLVAEVEIFEGE